MAKHLTKSKARELHVSGYRSFSQPSIRARCIAGTSDGPARSVTISSTWAARVFRIGTSSRGKYPVRPACRQPARANLGSGP